MQFTPITEAETTMQCHSINGFFTIAAARLFIATTCETTVFDAGNSLVDT
ncbi:MAG: hypothetical protein JW959_11335 [Pirellulales bacterium]|nr:hypothetical protein [Pirellulales bacterium]